MSLSPRFAETQFRALVDGAEEYAVLALDADGSVAAWNAGAERLVGYRQEEILGRRLSTFEPPDDEPADFEADLARAATEGGFAGEAWWRRKDGSRFRARIALRTVREDESLLGYTAIVRDVTDRWELERYRTLVDTVGDGIYQLDADGRFVAVNDTIVAVTGYDREALLGASASLLLGATDVERVRARISDLLESEGTTSEPIELDVRTAAGETIPCELRLCLLLSDGEFRGTVGVVRDVSHRRERECELRRERELTERLLETVPVPLTVHAADGEVLRANRRVLELFDLTEEELIDRPPAEHWPVFDPAGERLSPADLPIGRVLDTGEPVLEQEVAFESPDGTRLWFLMNAAPVSDDDGEIERIVVAGETITRQKEYQRELERGRERLKRELNEVLSRVTDAVFALDADGRFTYLNEPAERVFGRPERELLGVTVGEALSDALTPSLRRQCERLTESGRPISFEEYFPPLDAWFRVHVYPSETGVSVYFRDVTERKRRERELERYETIVDAVKDGIYALDDESRFVLVNEAYASMTGRPRDALLGAPASAVIGEEMAVETEALQERLAAGREFVTLETDLPTADGGAVPVEARLTLLPLDGERFGRAGVVRDITERRWFERTLAALHGTSRDLLRVDTEREVCECTVETAVELLGLPGAVVFLLDGDGSLRPGACSADAVDLLGGEPVLDPADRSLAWLAFREGRTVTAADLRAADAAYPPDAAARSGVWVPLGDRGVFAVVSGDAGALDRRRLQLARLLAATTEAALDRVAQEDSRRRREAQLEALAETSGALLDAQTPQDVCDLAVETARTALHLPTTMVALHDEPSGTLRARAGSPGADAVLDADRLLDADEELAWRAYAENRLRVVSDRRPRDAEGDEPSASSAAILPLGRHGVFVVGAAESVDAESDAAFSDVLGGHTEPAFARILTANVESALDRTRREQQLVERETLLQRQNRSLERLNRVNTVIRRIHGSLVDASSRREIERAVCTQLTTAGPYVLAWVGAYDPVSGTVTPSEWSGVENGYLDRLQRSAERAAERDPIGSAIETGRPQVVDDILDDPPFEPWRREALRRGYRSMVALPLRYRDALYGVLCVYADRPNVFDDLERAVLRELSETIAHSLNALESRRALLSEGVVEVEFAVRDPSVSFLRLTAELDAEFDLVSLVSARDDGVHAFFTVSGASPEAVRSFLDRALDVSDVRRVSERDGECLFECLVDESHLLAVLLDRGAVAEAFVAASGAGRITVTLAQDADVRALVGALKARYAEVDLVARRERPSTHRAPREFEAQFDELLTERQREVLRTAYFSGFFESPRPVTGGELAERFDIAQPTFNAHLRAALRKLLGLLYDGD
ncbi:PAS domain S-box protein [Halegenticoccus soli]|uniref:PAS domain S-box protein n=1 Tax=Halegenticoccus soli TaxID=1985678 RepID=UPI000C6D8D31|nr:PAS domain S-box protein [Halegenticoccus soli]